MQGGPQRSGGDTGFRCTPAQPGVPGWEVRYLRQRSKRKATLSEPEGAIEWPGMSAVVVGKGLSRKHRLSVVGAT